ncbi:E-selectin-like [Ambystoma mexicanum]|uniref:E-selectin-like n=1 Tax=Ambystoma mexicanum TaxID=8296 RepID=UPI0037E833BE
MFSEVDSWTYQHSSATMNYIQARQWCRAHYTDMVAIQNGEENEHLNEILPFTPTYYWIGIRKIRNQWTWVGTSKALTEEAKNWEDNEPNNKKNNEDCVEIYIKRRRDPTSCHAASCSGNGECVETINNHTCQCYEGFYGSECQHMMPCEPLEAPRPGFLNCSHPVQEFSYNSSCQISCVEGYALNSLDSVQCTSSGRWTATMSECQVMKCNGLEDPAQGVMNCSHPLGDFMFNSTCNFACDKGFVMTGSDRLQCGASGEWDGNQPECEAVQCDQVTMVEHSTVTCSGSYGKYSYNATCDFTCDEGYAMSGSAGLRCTAEGEWTDEVPKCEDHLKLHDLNDTKASKTSKERQISNLQLRACGSQRSTQCSLRMVAKRDKHIEPPSWDLWKFFHWCFLTVIYFDLLTFSSIDCWTYHVSSEAMPWEQARAFCQKNYTDLVAIQNRMEIEYLNATIQYNPAYYWIGIRKLGGQWTWVGTNKTLTDEAVNWGKGEPNNRNKKEDCVEMYIKRHKDAGKWNDDACSNKNMALCYTASCNKTSCSGHGECEETINNYTCNCHEGFYGRECQYVIRCSGLTAPAQGSMNCTNRWGHFSFHSVCEFDCSEGWSLTGSSSLECSALGHWTAEAPRCRVIHCSDLAAPVRGSMSCSHLWGNFSFGTVCEFSCEEGWVLSGSNALACRALGNWTAEAPCCEVIHCSDLSAPVRGSMSCSHLWGNFSFGTVCEFSCEEGWVLSGSNALACRALGNWTAETPCCEAIQCKPLTAPAGGSIQCIHSMGHFRFGSVCQFTCHQGSLPPSSNETECQATGEWTIGTPQCSGANDHYSKQEYYNAAFILAGSSVCALTGLMFSIWLVGLIRKKVKKSSRKDAY